VTIGIPTLYRGVMFRSRLEARWAAFFDLIGWAWTYEPQDLAGYIPDFSVAFEAAPLLVEVKHALTPETLALASRKVERSGWNGETLIVGSELFDVESATPRLGIFGEREDIAGEREWLWSPARAFWCLSCGHTSVLAEDGSWRCRSCGVDGGNAHLGQLPGGLREQWVDAGNRVQWRPAAE
jgi:hypothetical protein